MGKGALGKSERASEMQGQIAGRTMDIAEMLLNQAAPARTTTQNAYSSIIKGGNDLQKYVAPQINAAAQQYGLARTSAKELLPPGGQRDKALRDISLAEAGAKTGIYSSGVSDALAKLTNIGWGGTNTGLSAYGQAGSGYGSVANNYMNIAQQQQAGWSGLAGGIGSLAGMYI